MIALFRTTMIYVEKTNPLNYTSNFAVVNKLFSSKLGMPAHDRILPDKVIHLAQTSTEIVYGVYHNQNLLAYVHLTKVLQDKWNVSSVMTEESRVTQGIMTNLFQVVLRDLGHIISNKVQNIGTKSLYLRFVEKNPEYSLWSIDVNNGLELPFDYDNQDQYWDGRENIRIMIKRNQ